MSSTGSRPDSSRAPTSTTRARSACLRFETFPQSRPLYDAAVGRKLPPLNLPSLDDAASARLHRRPQFHQSLMSRLDHGIESLVF